MRFETKAIRLPQAPDPHTGAVVPPIHTSTTYIFTEILKTRGFDYSRSINPSRAALEGCVAALEGGAFCVSFGSGMAACDGVLSVLRPGDEVVAARNLYSGTLRLFDTYYAPRGNRFVYVEGNTLDQFRDAITEKTKFVWIETPTNPQLQILDIRALAAICRAKGVQLVVDNTFASPFLQRPLELGADIALHSTSKYISGHNDVIGGALVMNDPKLHEAIRFYQNTAGAVPSPFDCYLSMRGIKTLAVRMRQHCANAQKVAQFLAAHPLVERVYYPGLATHPGHDLAARQMSGFGAMLAFDLKHGGDPLLNAFFLAFKVFFFAESLGGVESLICHPTTMSHAILTEEQRLQAGITPRMVRVSIGLEHADDLVEDMAQALAAAEKYVP